MTTMLARLPEPTLDRPPLYPDILALGVPRGWKAGLRARAEAEGTSVAALVRDAIERLAKPSRKKWQRVDLALRSAREQR